MITDIYKELAKNKMYRETFIIPKESRVPEEVQIWPDYLQESFCVLSVQHQDAGFDLEEADRTAIRQVKESARYQEWLKTAEITESQEPTRKR
jgi:hypothetical protein